MARQARRPEQTRSGRGWLVVSYLAGVASTLLVLSVSGCGQRDEADPPEPAPPPVAAAPAATPPPVEAPVAAPAPTPADADAAEQAQIAEDAAAAGMTSRTQAGEQH